WHTKRPNNEESIQHLLAAGRAKIKEGSLIMIAVDLLYSGAATSSRVAKLLSISGFPKQTIIWRKDGQPLRSGACVRLLSTEHIRITLNTQDNEYIVKNNLESAQSTADLKLGGG
ncbi:unnamed protein product, partial [Ceratitis capitata]